MRLTVGTTVVPNLANRGNKAGKSIPLSQILAPPETDPDSGFTSVSVGVGSPSVLSACMVDCLVGSGLEMGPAFQLG